MRAICLAILLLVGSDVSADELDGSVSSDGHVPLSATELWVAVYVHEFGRVEDWVCVSAGQKSGEYIDPYDDVMKALRDRIASDNSVSQTALPVSECGVVDFTDVYYVDQPENAALLLMVKELGAATAKADSDHVHEFFISLQCGSLCGHGEWLTVFDEPAGLRIEQRISYGEDGTLLAMSLSLLKFVGQASLVDDAMLPS